LDRLRGEALSIIEDTILRANIKISAIEHRTKDVESILIKWRAKGLSSLSDVSDAVGLRIICLFRSDIRLVLDAIGSAFEQVSVDDKVNSSVNEFGYMSVHCLCQLQRHYAGPRYDDIKNMVFEIQIRTIAMHAWATISHFIDYKREADAPADLRKSLNALSALFYVADTQFEAFAREAEESRRTAEEFVSGSHPPVDRRLDLDTLKAIAARFFPDRRANVGDWSELLNELSAAEISSADQLVRYLSYRPALVEDYEEISRQRSTITKKAGKYFTQIGAIRVCLANLSGRYLSANPEMSSPLIQSFMEGQGLPDLDAHA
jgi:ppGpp synthetase/RelA/SpoT-type nucleotidyltranferase